MAKDSPKEVRVFAPATVANVACGYDVLGFAIEEPGDEIVARFSDKPGLRIVPGTVGQHRLRNAFTPPPAHARKLIPIVIPDRNTFGASAHERDGGAVPMPGGDAFIRETAGVVEEEWRLLVGFPLQYSQRFETGELVG